MQFMPNSPSPPRGTMWSLLAGMMEGTVGAQATGDAGRTPDASTVARPYRLLVIPAQAAAIGVNCYQMTGPRKSSWLVSRAQAAIQQGLTQAYDTIKVDAARYLYHLRVAHGLPIASFRGVYTIPTEVLDDIAKQTIRAGMKLA